MLPCVLPCRTKKKKKQRGDRAGSDSTEHRALRGEQRRAKARARESAAAAATTPSNGVEAPVDAINPAVLPYVAYGLATPPTRLVELERTGADARRHSSASAEEAGGDGGGSIGGAAPGARGEASVSDRGGDSAGGKSPTAIPKPINGSTVRPLDSMAELFVSHQLQARRPGKDGGTPREGSDVVGGGGGGGGDKTEMAPSSTVVPGAAFGASRDVGEAAPLGVSPANADGLGKTAGYYPSRGSSGGDGEGRQPGAKQNGSNGDKDQGRFGSSDGDEGNGPSPYERFLAVVDTDTAGHAALAPGTSADNGEARVEADHHSDQRRSQSLTTDGADPPPYQRNPDSPEGRIARSDSEDVARPQQRGLKSGGSGRKLGSWRRFGSKRNAGGDRDGERADGIDLDSSTRSVSCGAVLAFGSRSVHDVHIGCSTLGSVL